MSFFSYYLLKDDNMNKKINERVLKEAKYIIKSKKTVREVAGVSNVSKSTVHKDMQERLYVINKELHEEVEKIFNYHKEIRHINGGLATKNKYLKIKKCKNVSKSH